MKNLLYKYTSGFLALLLVALVPTSCIEEFESESAGKGSNKFRVPAGTFSLIAYNAAVEKRTIIDLFRDVVSNSALNESASVGYTISEEALIEYNDENDTDFVLLPAANYTLSGVEGGNVTFEPGEFAKPIELTLNPEGLDFSKQYALAFTFSNPSSGYGISATSPTVVTQITVKNAFDGMYKVNIGQAGWTAFGIYEGAPIAYPGTVSFATAGATTVSFTNDYTGTNLFPGFSDDGTGPAATQFGAISPVFTFDANGKLTGITNPAVDARNRQLVLNPAASADENVFNLEDKSFRFNLLFKQNTRPDMTVIMIGEYDGPR
ncbi:MAG TPA: DUF1735 domain-containing protein [Chryseosolibacter sp.]